MSVEEIRVEVGNLAARFLPGFYHCRVGAVEGGVFARLLRCAAKFALHIVGPIDGMQRFLTPRLPRL